MKASTLGCPAVDPPSTPERIASGHSDDPFEHTQIQTHKNTHTHKFKHTNSNTHTHTTFTNASSQTFKRINTGKHQLEVDNLECH